PRVAGRDHGIDVAAVGGDVGVEQGVFVLLLAVGPQRLDLAGRGGGEFLAVQDIRRAGGAHHGDLRGWPGQVDVGAEVLGAHRVIRAAVGLAGDHRDLGHGGLGVGVDQFGAAPDDAVPFLAGAGQETGYVDEGEYRDVERVAGPHEPGGLLAGVDVQAAR